MMRLGGWAHFTNLRPEGVQEIHVIPRADLRAHDVGRECWCSPEQDVEQPCVFIHNSLDRREEYERGELRLQ